MELTIEADMPAMTAVVGLAPAGRAALVVAFGIAMGLALISARRRVRGTTLGAPWLWAVQAAVSVTAVELAATAWHGAEGPAWLWPVRYLCGIATLCPLVAVLGAKRPQDQAWQFVVLALVVVLGMPAASALAFDYGSAMSVDAARRWLLALLIALGIFNYLPTRFAAASLLVCLAQIFLLGDQLPWPGWGARLDRGLTGLALGAVGCGAAALAGRRPRTTTGMNRWWLDFRDAFGAVWALRIGERFNAASTAADWPVALRWRGFVRPSCDESISNQGAETTRQGIEQAFRTLLRRFVSNEWLASRADAAPAAAAPLPSPPPRRESY